VRATTAPNLFNNRLDELVKHPVPALHGELLRTGAFDGSVTQADAQLFDAELEGGDMKPLFLYFKVLEFFGLEICVDSNGENVHALGDRSPCSFSCGLLDAQGGVLLKSK
jgi:hypothetical protein